MTKIEWTNETWNPIVGCSKCSPGCLNCYAERMAYRLFRMGHYGYGRVTLFNKWSGHTYLRESALEKPLHWRKPRMIFVGSMTDLFHENTPFKWVDKLMAVIALCPQHQFQVLTKRPERMKEYVLRMKDAAYCIADTILHPLYGAWNDPDTLYDSIVDRIINWSPLRNLWLGVTVCNQEEAHEKIPVLLDIPAKIRFVSIEPILEEIELPFCAWEGLGTCPHCGLDHGAVPPAWPHPQELIDWVIVGPETGPRRRPCEIEWIDSIVRQCEQAQVPCFVKAIEKDGKIIKSPAGYPCQYPKGADGLSRD